jgi:MFS family permease
LIECCALGIGSLLFGYLADRFGRRKLFIVTPTIYLVASQACAFAWNFYSLFVCTFFIGLGIGGEYSAMNSAINEVRNIGQSLLRICLK